MVSFFSVLVFFQMLLPHEPGGYVRHFRQVIPSKGCRKQQPNWAGLSALDPEQDTSSLHPDKGLPPLTRAGSFTPGTPDNGHCIPLDPCPGKTEILRSCPQRILSVSPVFPKLPSREWAVLPLRKKSVGIHPRFPSKAWLSSGCIGSLPLQNRLAAGRQWRFASFHRGGASPRWRNRMHPVPSNGQNKNDQLSSFDYGWSPLLWPL
jgi:hypothetical protein